jgi:hypothetical protein
MEQDYLKHPVFGKLTQFATFYENLANSVMSFATMGVQSYLNIDTYVYTSMQGTLDSIREILLNARINDGYTLLRKYHDAVVINLYTNLYLEQYFADKYLIVEKINNWVKSKEHLPNFVKMMEYIENSEKTHKIAELLNQDTRYRDLRRRCDDHIHYNRYYYMLVNDNQIFLRYRGAMLNQFSSDLENIFILHLAYLFSIKENYMMASDYIDCLEGGIPPEPDSQYFVAPFIQEIFNDVIKKSRMDLALEIKQKTVMRLE